MTTLMPMDGNANAIPALRLKDSGAHVISASASAARNTQGFDSETMVVSVYATTPVYLKFGDQNVMASSGDHYFPAGVYYDFAIGDDLTGRATHLSVLRVTQDGEVYISEKH